MSKQDPYRFNLRFDDTDKDHRKVCDFLNTCGRKKQDTINEQIKKLHNAPMLLKS